MGRVSLAIVLMLMAVPASAHQVPFSYVDARLDDKVLTVTLVAHIVDLAHELDLEPPELLLNPEFLAAQRERIATLLEPRLRFSADGQRLAAPEWSDMEPLAERQSIRMHRRYPLARAPGVLAVDARMFPYDPPHQTFVNVYDRVGLRHQTILDQVKTHTEYFSATGQGTVATVRRFVPAGIEHILIGPDHLLFLFGLLLLGGSLRHLALLVSAFTVAHSLTLTLAALNYVSPPARIVEPAIALSIIYVGADNLMVRDGRDMRIWIALAFGLIHGFGFAGVLRDMDLPRKALAWSLVSFNSGVEIGQLLVVSVVGSVLAAVRSRHQAAAQQLVFTGSIVVIAAGAFWFIQRVFFPRGIA
jgi:hydrogenase/urease accessory protein HupE